MSTAVDFEVRPTRAQLAERWRALCADPTFEDWAGKIELTEWGEILVSPVGKTHGLTAGRVADELRRALRGHTLLEVGVATDLGIRAPDVAWCSDAYVANHPEEAPLSSGPEICVEIFSASNALPKLREKGAASVRAGAREAWIVIPDTRAVDFYGTSGRVTASTFPVDTAQFF